MYVYEKNLTPVSESSGSTPLMSSAFPLACSAAMARFNIHTSIPLNSGGEEGGEGGREEGGEIVNLLVVIIGYRECGLGSASGSAC